MTELICHFGKYKDKPLSDIPAGYLRWCVENINPVPEPKYRFDDDGKPLSPSAVEAMEENMRGFLNAAEDELLERDET